MPERHLLTCNGRPVPLTATGTPGSHVAGVRYKAWNPWSSLHPTIDVDSPLSFDLIDRVSRFSLGGATYHVVHPGGRSYDHPPVNASEAEARRARRFEAMGHTTGMIDLEALDAQLITRSAGDDEYPLTLDLRRRVPAPGDSAPLSLGAVRDCPGRYLAAASQSTAGAGAGFDEFAAADGTVREGWSSLLDGLDEFADADLLQAQREVARLLEDDNVTYTPSPASAISIADEPNGHGPPLRTRRPPYRATAVAARPLPLIIDDREWAGLEAGLVQRAELLDAIMADLYGARRLLSRRHIPAAAIFDHDEYLRPLVGSEAMAGQRLFMIAADLGRDSSGQWKVISDRTQAPSGAGYAMQNRRVVSRVMPEIYHQANLHRLTPFFQAMRLALVDAAPGAVEDPRVVVLSPGTHSETAFDQAFVASLLGFPLLEGSDLTVRDGRVDASSWQARGGRRDLAPRSTTGWTAELRPDSRLGVTGLMECVRQGTVSVLNNLGSGCSRILLCSRFLPELCERLLGQSLRLPSVETWWCGDEAALSHVLNSLDSSSYGRSAVVTAAVSVVQL